MSRRSTTCGPTVAAAGHHECGPGDQTDELARAVTLFSTLVTDVPEVYLHPYDPDDSAYVNLALKVDARLIVSRDRHLLMLSDAARKEGR